VKFVRFAKFSKQNKNKRQYAIQQNSAMSRHITLLHVSVHINRQQAGTFCTAIQKHRCIWARNYPVGEMSLKVAIYLNNKFVSHNKHNI